MPILPSDALCRSCDPDALGFDTTDDLEDLEELLGQERASEAIEFAAEMPQEGYNLFVLGRTGVGRRHLLHQLLGKRASEAPVPDDWCYLYNFAEPTKPRALRLPAGRGIQLRAEMARLVEDLAVSIPAAFDAEEFRGRRQALVREFEKRKEEALSEFHAEAEKRSMALISGPSGLGIAPLKEGKPIPTEEVEKLPKKDRAKLEKDMEEVSGLLDGALHQFPRLVSDQERAMRELAQETTTHAVEHLVKALKARWKDLPDVIAHLEAVTSDVIEDPSGFVGEDEEALEEALTGGRRSRYEVNVLVDHSQTEGAPLVHEDNPTMGALIGRVEHLSRMGNLVTDFTLVRAGALHRANGGYLVLDAQKVLTRPMAWEQLKRALRSKEVQIQSMGDELSLVTTVTLEPEPIPLDLKVALVGDRQLYYLLDAVDPEFALLFKVPADFEDEMDRTADGYRQYARMIATLVRYNGLQPFDRGAVARVLTEASRLAGDGTKLTTHIDSLSDLLRGSDHHARKAGREVVQAEDVRGAIEQERRLRGRVRDQSLEEMVRGTLRIATEGEAVGELNGLSVLALGRASFGRPGRITARVRMGRGRVIDIEREVDLGGPIHTKGVLILSGFVGARYAPDRPLAFSASLVFEQSYGPIDGDSASLAETLALLSAIAEVPLRQDIAVTGSIDLFGRVQAIGGVNEKIEGFFDLCAARGLTGTQGVVIPATNASHLVLREEVVEAVVAKEFSVWTVDTVDEAMALFTGMEAGVRGEDGAFPDGTVNAAVEARLIHLAEKAADFGKNGDGQTAD